MPIITNTFSTQYELNAFCSVHSTLPPILYSFYSASKEHFLAPSLSRNYPPDLTLFTKSTNINVCCSWNCDPGKFTIQFSPGLEEPYLTYDSCKRTCCLTVIFIHASDQYLDVGHSPNVQWHISVATVISHTRNNKQYLHDIRHRFTALWTTSWPSGICWSIKHVTLM
jgi:hypothetical protein